MRDAELDILLVAPDSCWPVTNGGQARVNGLAGALRNEFTLGLAAPWKKIRAIPPEIGVPIFPLPVPKSTVLSGRASVRPRLGHFFLGKDAGRALGVLIEHHRPSVVLFSHSYLAAMVPTHSHACVVVDFPNIESERMRSLASSGRLQRRLGPATEALKARMWEPKVARSAHVSIAVGDDDARRIKGWGGNPVVVPNVAEQMADGGLSPENGPAVFIASFGYEPNAVAAETILREIWPNVLRVAPAARLVLAGYESDTKFGWASSVPGVTVAGQVATMAPVLAKAAVVLAPVKSGGGTQLKVAHGLAARRVVVATSYSARSIPTDSLTGCVVRDDWEQFADAVASLLTNVSDRHQRENVLRQTSVSSWIEAAEPLVTRIGTLAASRCA